jgi:hypothetical protein
LTLRCNEIVALAAEAGHSAGKIEQGQLLLNAILSDIAQTYDIAAARGQYVFNFNPTITAPLPLPQTPSTRFGSGPYFMPADYLRLSGSSGSTGAQRSFIWYLNGVPYPVIPCDLAEFDMQVQQAGLQSYVWLAATDMATPIDDRILLTTTGNVTGGSTTITLLNSTQRLIAGLGVSGQGIVPGTTVLAVDLAAQTCEISQPGMVTIPQASLIFGYPPIIWIYPPPSSAQQAMIRYQRRMPPVTDFTRFPWFDNDGYLIEKLTGRYCQLNDDTRAERLLGGPGIAGSPDNKLSLWLAAKDDEASHPKTVQLDRRRFGPGWHDLPTTKKVGWC